MPALLQAISDGVSTTTAAVGTAISQNLPGIMVIFGGLIALGLIIRLIKRLIGRRA